MAKYDDIQSRIYNLKTKSIINEEMDMSMINYNLYNNSNLGKTISKITTDQINSNNLLESICNIIIKSQISIQEQKEIGDSLIRTLPNIQKIKKYKNSFYEVANKINNPLIKDKVNLLIECDRIINNQEKLVEYSKFDFIFENYFLNNDLETIVV